MNGKKGVFSDLFRHERLDKITAFRYRNTVSLMQSQQVSRLRTVRVHEAQVAQLVEQRTENPCVAGSIPALGTTIPHQNYEAMVRS